MAPMKVILFANTDWYLYNFRLSLAKALRAEGAEVVLISPHGSFGERLKDEGFRWITVPMRRSSLNPLREFGFLIHLARLYRSEKPDVVHNFTIKCVVYGAFAARLAGIQSRINAVAGMGYVFSSDARRAWLLRPLVRALLRLALGGRQSRLVLQNPEDHATFVASGLVDSDRVRLIAGSGVDVEHFHPMEDVAPRDGIFRVLLAARLLWDKGVREYVEAARHLKAQGLPIEFLLAGNPDEGNPASVPATVIQAWREEGVVKLLGHVDHMPACFRRVDLAVLPSYREGLPKSLIEAAACGLPVIASDVPGCREAVVQGSTGLLVPSRDTRALAEAIRFMRDNPEICARMGKAGRDRVLREFDENIILEKTLDVYRELAAGFSS